MSNVYLPGGTVILNWLLFFDIQSTLCIQELIVLRAIRDANVPKFLMEDLKLFNGIVSDLFPKIRDVPVDYGEMELSIREKSIEHGLEDVEGLSLYIHV